MTNETMRHAMANASGANVDSPDATTIVVCPGCHVPRPHSEIGSEAWRTEAAAHFKCCNTLCNARWGTGCYHCHHPHYWDDGAVAFTVAWERAEVMGGKEFDSSSWQLVPLAERDARNTFDEWLTLVRGPVTERHGVASLVSLDLSDACPFPASVSLTVISGARLLRWEGPRSAEDISPGTVVTFAGLTLVVVESTEGINEHFARVVAVGQGDPDADIPF